MNSIATDSHCAYDVVTLGETMLRFSPPGRQRLETTDQFQVHVGGSESNTAVGLARLGMRTAWLSRLPATSLGRMVSSELSRHGVDVSHVVWAQNERLGLYFLEEGGPPRGSQVLYDRADSAVSRMRVEELPAWLAIPGQMRLFHTTGITLAISEQARATALQATRMARQAGAKVSFDVNYRSKLWSSAAAAQHCRAMFELADVVFLPDRDAQTLFNLPAASEPTAALQILWQQFPNITWVMTRGREGSMALSGGTFFTEGIFASDEVGRLGGGDSFSAGFLTRYLDSQGDVGTSLRWGAATSAIKYSIPGDLPILSRSEVESLVASGSGTSLSR